ncbi:MULTISPECIES: type I restriction endonuclease subunit R [unclassified Variovorax]|uniref:type I restriction endonuclease subunit R n=1 Tax=unclassified Variovorax TaxID=663243 RepID=UPI0013192D8F|nr:MULTISPECIES: type I restriction endonuclease [unclassified Variovorax]VTU42360.1 Type I restriction enzyme EcoR124II R protein [Variovorax sp. SRS16]VTU42385.1 Type I restriction enzyme EcoR124II R protein [Variovorax sp. PBL-E5]VTU44137.1 Type I restriction enzyme EcoR124II R protein [Variovorax sp. PBL-H6]
MPTTSNIHTERVFENELCTQLEAHGWSVKTHPKQASSYSKEYAILAEDLLAFVQDTQPTEWAKFKKWHNGQSDAVFVKRVAKQLDTHGTLHLLRHGFKDVDAKFFLCQFKPAHKKNPKLLDLYQKNRLTVVRQLHYSLHNENSIDLTLFVSGLPVATGEIKTDLTQNVKDAISQYKKDRLPKDPKSKELEPLLQFKTRALVHFAISSDLVFMTTKLAGDDTQFLPFNIGRPDGVDMLSAGAGNPPAPPGKGYPTYYLWEYVWRPDVWLEVLGEFMHLEAKEVEDSDGKKATKESLIFPRYHQLVAVQELIRAAAEESPGKDYLVQHSAGSGKSNSIAWVAHRLSNLHDAADKKTFDTVVVVTDRRVLDKQLQDTISQFEHRAGVVQVISENSAQLAMALNVGAPIVVTTLQKFGFILDQVGALGKRKFALIVDEAHSSQTGTAARKLREALTKGKPKQKAAEVIDGVEVQVEADVDIDPEDLTSEDMVALAIEGRKRPENVSYFAFTATPKSKTLELFGRKGPEGTPVPFHVYSMRQAIEEGFILDVLRHYTSYSTFYKLGAVANEKLVPQKKAKMALAQYAKLHPHNISQKVVVIVEHFREHVAAKIGGKAKAMLVTDSRKAAVRYKLAIDRYIKDQKYTDLRTLVAFSGAVLDPDSGADEFTESNMNDVKGQEPSEAFKQDEYRILLVANKYQVGFDQPLLHTMYVDKRLSGVLAVQTLSRLNRMYPGKEDTFVLDFVNRPDEILASFQPYYRTAQLEDVTDPNVVHELFTKLDKAGVYYWTEVEQFAAAFFDPKVKSQGALHAVLKPAFDRYEGLEDEPQELFRKDLGSFLRLYEFLSQIIPYDDPELEKLFVFGKNLMPRLAAHGKDKHKLELDADVKLTHYRLQKVGEQQLDLEKAEVVKLPGIGEAGTGSAPEDEKKALREIVAKMNDLFSGHITESDFIGAVTTWQGHLAKNEKLAAQARNNSEEQFAMGDFKDAFTDVVIEAQDAHNQIAEQLLKDERIFGMMQKMVAKMVWQGFQQGPAART